MQIFLHNLDGTQQVVELASDTTLESLLQQEGSRLICQGSILTSLDGLNDNANVYVTGDLDGGKKKKKKKVYTTKKKNKHIHKRVKLLALSLYSVDGITNFIQEKATSLNNAKLVPLADLEPSWLNIGIVIIADSATPPLRWMPKLLRRTKKK